MATTASDLKTAILDRLNDIAFTAGGGTATQSIEVTGTGNYIKAPTVYAGTTDLAAAISNLESQITAALNDYSGS